MKLYIEEQVKEMIDDAHNGIDGYYDIFKKHTPIELPSDGIIKKEATTQMEEWNGSGCEEEIFAFIKGANWMKDKIQGGDK